MNLLVLWTDEATETFESIVIQIENKWGLKSAKEFVAKTNKTIAIIADHPYLFKSAYQSNLTNLRQAIITKHTSLFYEVNSSYIALLYFWDNRQEPMVEIN